jgi:nucleotide-binding universal stress UspA family protein
VTTTTPTPSSALPPGSPDDGSGGSGSRPVVVGADGSECGLRAVRWAAEEDARRDAPLRIVHASTVPGRSGVAGASPRGLPRARGVTAQAYTVARHTAPSVAASTDVVTGDPVAALLRAAADAQLVVLGIATTGAADEMVLAPVAQKVAARSPQPVVVVPRHGAAGAPGRPLVALLGLGEVADDEPVALFAADVARRTDRPLTVLHAHPDTPRGWPGDPAAWEERFPEVRATHQPLPAVTGSSVLAAACPTPLLTMSAGHGGLLHRPMDSLHRWLLRHCTSPMALVPPVSRLTGAEPREEIIALG